MAPSGRGAGDPLPGEHGVLLQAGCAALGDGGAQPERRAARRVHLRPVVELDDLRVEVRAQEARRLAAQVEEDVHRDREVGRHHQGDALGERFDLLALGRLEPGGADDAGDPPVRRAPQEVHRGVGGGEHDGHLPGRQGRVGIVGDGHAPTGVAPHPRVPRRLEGRAHGEVRVLGHGGPHPLPHAAEGADHDHPVRGAHSSPYSLRAIRSRSWFALERRVSGSRISGRTRPRMARASLIGIGFVSQNMASNRGWRP